jgi:hypothetical protein
MDKSNFALEDCFLMTVKRDIIFIVVAAVLMFASLAEGAERLMTTPSTQQPNKEIRSVAPIKSLPVHIPVVITLQPFVMTGLRGIAPVFQPVSIPIGTFSMTGLRGLVATFQPLTLTIGPFAMMGLRGTVEEFKPVILTLSPFIMTGLRP